MNGKLRLMLGVLPILPIIVSAGGLGNAAQLITNGGFESGFSNWTVVNEAASSGSFFIQSGTTSPINGFTVPAPPQGASAAMTDDSGPGSHALLQSFTVAPGSMVTLSFDLFVGNQSSFFNPPSLDFNTIANQQARVDILSSTAGAFDVGTGVVDNVYTPTSSTANYDLLSFDISNFVGAGGTFQLRFAEVDNLGPFNLGVDNVSIVANPVAAPEPATWVLGLLAFGVTAFAFADRRASSSR